MLYLIVFLLGMLAGGLVANFAWIGVFRKFQNRVFGEQQAALKIVEDLHRKIKQP